MKNCIRCNTENEDNAKFCSTCGSTLAAPEEQSNAFNQGFGTAESQNTSQQQNGQHNPYLQNGQQQNPYQQNGQQQNPYQQNGQQQNPYQQNPFEQNPYQNMYNQYEQQQRGSATAWLILGIFSIIMSALNYIGVPFVHLVGIALGIVAIIKSAIGIKLKDKHAIGGLVTGIIGLSMGIGAIIFAFIYLALSSI